MTNNIFSYPLIVLLTLLLIAPLTVSAQAKADNGSSSQQKNDRQLYVQATVVEPFINMRVGPGRGYAIFYVAERGETVSVLKSRTSWYKVKNQRGISGWVHADDIALTIDLKGQQLAIPRQGIERYQQRNWEAGLLAGDFEGNDAISVYGSFHFNKNLSAELNYLETFGDTSNGQGAFVSLVHQPFPQWRISPFITLGGGMYKTEPKSNLASTETRNDNVSFVGAGARMYLGHRLLLRLQYNNYLVISDRDDDEEIESWTIGISAFY